MKKLIIKACAEILDERIETIQFAISAQQDTILSESKSSAGDKYETSRAMAHLEQEKLSSQLSEVLNQKSLLESLDPHRIHMNVESGALVRTSRGIFYIGIGLGKISIDNQEVFIISPGSPIAQAMLGYKAEDSFRFKDSEYKILQIE